MIPNTEQGTICVDDIRFDARYCGEHTSFTLPPLITPAFTNTMTSLPRAFITTPSGDLFLDKWTPTILPPLLITHKLLPAPASMGQSAIFPSLPLPPLNPLTFIASPTFSTLPEANNPTTTPLDLSAKRRFKEKFTTTPGKDYERLEPVSEKGNNEEEIENIETKSDSRKIATLKRFIQIQIANVKSESYFSTSKRYKSTLKPVTIATTPTSIPNKIGGDREAKTNEEESSVESEESEEKSTKSASQLLITGIPKQVIKNLLSNFQKF